MKATPTTVMIPGCGNRHFPLIPEVVKAIETHPEVYEVIVRNCQPDVFEQLLIADGRVSEKRLQRYRANLRREGWKLGRNGKWKRRAS